MRNRNRCYVLSIITVYSSSSHDCVCVCVCVCGPIWFWWVFGQVTTCQKLEKKNNRPVEFPHGLLLQVDYIFHPDQFVLLHSFGFLFTFSVVRLHHRETSHSIPFLCRCFNSDVWLCCASLDREKTQGSRRLLIASMPTTLSFSASKNTILLFTHWMQRYIKATKMWLLTFRKTIHSLWVLHYKCPLLTSYLNKTQ